MQAVRKSSPGWSRPSLSSGVLPYTARAIKGTALLEEMRALLRAYEPGETPDAFRRRMATGDPLGKATAARRDDLVRRVFLPRFLVDGKEPATSLRQLLDARGSGPWLPPLCLLFAARADVVLREAITVFLPEVRASGRSAVHTRDFIAFLEAQEARGRMQKPWSENVRTSVAQHVFHQLTDLGVLGNARRGVRTLLSYAPGDLPFAYLACELHRRGCSDAALVAYPDFLVWQMAEPEVRENMNRLVDLGLWIYQGAGSVVRISWLFSEWQTVLNILGALR
ncbi:BrxA family protein [Polyangium sp. 15x6]|uniref:BrxA family protein n=1 Tax=Polyangium sp. 15x6 TaxID=3042687 RepID=UPI002499CA3F|nr:BrxA family protein [Polyangium sp. 15x6]MDI3291589.1 DUF1819 family protein [Polyangium sp. 15x6]